jgi:hypothetical protein
MSNIIPFPSIRRHVQIRKTASFMISVDEKRAEGHLRDVLRRLEEGLIRKGIDTAVAAAERTAYEGALRSEVWRLVILKGGVA